jgi:hypothetical protein
VRLPLALPTHPRTRHMGQRVRELERTEARSVLDDQGHPPSRLFHRGQLEPAGDAVDPKSEDSQAKSEVYPALVTWLLETTAKLPGWLTLRQQNAAETAKALAWFEHAAPAGSVPQEFKGAERCHVVHWNKYLERASTSTLPSPCRSRAAQASR